MLILTRRIGERLKITTDELKDSQSINVTVTVLGIKGNQVRLGIDAPRDVSVHREEIYDRIQNERMQKLEQARAASHGDVASTQAVQTASDEPTDDNVGNRIEDAE